MQESLENLKQKLSKHFSTVVTSLIAILVLLFYLTSLLSQTISLSNTLVDILIYIIYFALILTLGSLAFVIYNYYDEESFLTPIMYSKSNVKDVVNVLVPKSEEMYAKSLDLTQLIEQYKVKLDYLSALDFKGFNRLNSLSQTEKVIYLQQQHPQLIATMLGYMPTPHVEVLLGMLSAEIREDVMMCFEENRGVDTSTLSILNEALYSDLSVVKNECVVLKELSRLEVRKVLGQISKIELMFALKGASQELQEMFFVNMSAKASNEFKTVLATNRDVSLSKSDNAIKNLYLLAQRLREDGKIRAT